MGKALANGHRVEMLDLLAQGERSVEVLAARADVSVALASAHLQTLRRAGLVASRRDGNRILYRLADAFDARLRAGPTLDRVPAHFRVREDRISKAGNVTVRYLGRLRHIGIGRAHIGERVKLLVADDHVRVVGADGSLLRELVLDASRDYQPRLRSSTMT